MSAPWESNPDFWNKPAVKSKTTHIGLGIKPKFISAVVTEAGVDRKIYKTTQELREVSEIRTSVLAYVEELDKWFSFSKSRNLWLETKILK